MDSGNVASGITPIKPQLSRTDRRWANGLQSKAITKTSWPTTREGFFTRFNACTEVLAICRLGDGRGLVANKSFTTLTGFSAAELMASSQADTWLDLQDWRRLCTEIQPSGQTNQSVIILRTKAGMARLAQLSVQRIEFECTPSLLVMAHDLTRSELAQVTMEANQRATPPVEADKTHTPIQLSSKITVQRRHE